MDMSMGMMGNGPALTAYPVFYYMVVGSAVAVATLANMYNNILCRQRISAAQKGLPSPSKPKSWFALSLATLFAVFREASNFSAHLRWNNRIFRLPTVGRTMLIVLNVVVLVVLCLYGQDLGNVLTREDIAFRCGVVTMAQLPLIFLLSGKNNIIGFLSGISHEKLNWLHRWCARCMLLTATMHMGYFFSAWAPYNYIGFQIKNDAFVWKGLAAWAVLVWIVFSSMTPIRGWYYELFVVQHVVSFTLFLAFVYIHSPANMKIYIWIPVALFAFDRLFRTSRFVYANLSMFHPAAKKSGQINGFWACRAEFTPLPHNTTRIVIKKPPISWAPGQHVFLSCQAINPLQSHPFTISSIPSDGRMEFLVKAQAGGTKRFFRYAEKTREKSGGNISTTTVAIEGPYGCHRPLRQFESIVLLAGSTGATFTIPLLRDAIEGWKGNGTQLRKWSLVPRDGTAIRRIRFVWVVKSKHQLNWFSEQLSLIYSDFQSLQESRRDIKLEMTVYVTCDNSFTEEHTSLLTTITAPLTTPLQETTGDAGYSSSSADDKKSFQFTNTELRETRTQQNGCEPDGICCCRTDVDENTSEIAVCCCGSGPTSSRVPSVRSSNASSLVQPKLVIHPSIKVISGRPKTREIIRRSLEQAFGESAVVVCGPQGLVADVKQDVCLLSDERAVHKGTGAQGIYLHTESFGY